jgi:hypothetical protein
MRSWRWGVIVAVALGLLWVFVIHPWLFHFE